MDAGQGGTLAATTFLAFVAAFVALLARRALQARQLVICADIGFDCRADDGLDLSVRLSVRNPAVRFIRGW
jgi:hypothetical protein